MENDVDTYVYNWLDDVCPEQENFHDKVSSALKNVFIMILVIANYTCIIMDHL